MPSEAGPLPLFRMRSTAEQDEAPTVRIPTGASEQPVVDLVQAPSAPAGSGQIVRCAWPLLALIGRLIAGAIPEAVDQFRIGAVSSVRDFERTALAAGINAREVAAARYVLCTALDEAVLTSRWGATAGWDSGSLLSQFHNETWGGEKVFTLIERALRDPQQYGDLLELCHFVMVLGFQGKYRLERDGSAQADALRRRLYDTLRPRFGAITPLPVPLPASAPGKGRMFRYVPVWVVGAVCLLIFTLTFAALNYKLKVESQAVAKTLDSLAFPGEPASLSSTAKR